MGDCDIVRRVWLVADRDEFCDRLYLADAAKASFVDSARGRLFCVRWHGSLSAGGSAAIGVGANGGGRGLLRRGPDSWAFDGALCEKEET